MHNNVQLISFICHYLINPTPTPVQVWNSVSLQREDLKTNHEEADVIIVHHLVRIESEASDDSYIKVVCSDIDHVLVQLIRFYLETNITMNVRNWRAHVLGERSYPPNSTETQAYHQMATCRTRPDRV